MATLLHADEILNSGCGSDLLQAEIALSNSARFHMHILSFAEWEVDAALPTFRACTL